MAATTMVHTRSAGSRRTKIINRTMVNGVMVLICFFWLVPTVGLLVSSFRPRPDVISSGWWTVFPHPEYVSNGKVQLTPGISLDQPIQVEGQSVSDDQLRAGYKLPDGRRLIWADRRARLVDVQTQQWTTRANFTLSNYETVLTGQQVTVNDANGNPKVEKGENMINSFISSLTVAIPATVIPILIAAFAAYAFAWMRFPGRKMLFAMIVGLLVIPGQVATIPILRDFSGLGIVGTYLGVWLVHTGFGLSLAIYLLYNYISQIPREILESAFIDGASPFTIFTRLILPLSVPALASFAIFQFLWTWNDYFVALIFLGSNPDTQVVTQRLAQMIGTRGLDWHLLTAGGFITMLLPLAIFFSLQRYFIRGLISGSVKG